VHSVFQNAPQIIFDFCFFLVIPAMYHEKEKNWQRSFSSVNPTASRLLYSLDFFPVYAHKLLRPLQMHGIVVGAHVSRMFENIRC
jgi:hypothetical protein